MDDEGPLNYKYIKSKHRNVNQSNETTAQRHACLYIGPLDLHDLNSVKLIKSSSIYVRGDRDLEVISLSYLPIIH